MIQCLCHQSGSGKITCSNTINIQSHRKMFKKNIVKHTFEMIYTTQLDAVFKRNRKFQKKSQEFSAL